ncbi:MAG: Serine/threonine protein phosphatase [uncultured Corynebacteriales bacterium]|uniref:Serine/threonine protein phosphatase n=1 Tax=uncultured Mycobacteriales bacterium TaxID=581187 RepID=A0A6J4JB92_9ACTN|nr:MAG: Serine/threonine protein phosphatase [uncultured Corynebacteriales bacterium]
MTAGAGGDPAERLAAAARAAAAAVAALGTAGRAPACTLVAATLDAGLVRVVGIGDSRVYWVPDEGPAELLTEDDSWAAAAVRAGEDPDRAWADTRAHTLTRWLGADAEVPAAVRTVRLEGPGLVLVCSDGLWNYLLDPAELGAAVRSAYAGDLLAGADALVGLALDRGGRDNVTVALLRHEGDPT